MQKSDIRILVIEDDPTLGRAIDEALRRAGYSTHLATNYRAAKNATKLADYRGLVVDCMLPQKSGVETAIELINESYSEPVVILTSGIYKDKSFVHEAKLKTKATAFLVKPFDITEIVDLFDVAFRGLLDAVQEPFYQLLMRPQSSAKDRVMALNNTAFLHGYDLPLVYSMLSDPGISGELKIEYNENETAMVTFNRGQICGVRMEDKASYFGLLLVEKGFTTPEELREGLEINSSKPIGERLVDSSFVSPHAIQIVQQEQAIIRISKTIRDESVKVTFTEASHTESDMAIETVQFMQLVSDWICSKLPEEWLSDFYRRWMDYPVVQGPQYDRVNLFRHLPATMELFSVHPDLRLPESLAEFLARSPDNEAKILRGLHYLLLQRVLVFGEKDSSPMSYDTKIQRLEKINYSMQKQNYFEVLGIGRNARPSEINRSYHDLAKTLHPDKLPPNCPQELRDLAQNVFTQITEAYQTLSSDVKRQNYLKTLEMGVAEEMLKAESAFEEAVRILETNNFRAARKAFEKIMKLRGARSDIRVYYLWSLIKEKRHRMDRVELAAKASEVLEQVAHEDRHSVPYFFVKGMLYELRGQVQKAYNHFRHCITIDPHFMHAKREMAYIKSQYLKRTKSRKFSDDVSVAMKSFFKKNVG